MFLYFIRCSLLFSLQQPHPTHQQKLPPQQQHPPQQLHHQPSPQMIPPQQLFKPPPQNQQPPLCQGMHPPNFNPSPFGIPRPVYGHGGYQPQWGIPWNKQQHHAIPPQEKLALIKFEWKQHCYVNFPCNQRNRIEVILWMRRGRYFLDISLCS
ncbi:uncharacterized protein LOC129921537 isoform X2 [Episyrphus balteatus]|uniref:uncharacterized protein LOC129921537 isoform X2 n=1 Tax=Episyrphus balteatus TaxID=286459 RepID=UPI0024861077|nr:uncharacterized protein LOC129921537 isoform X2 [Episyrphus balteatus]